MQLRPSQGGKMRGPVGDTETLHRTAQASLAQYHNAHDDEGARGLIERVKTDRPCRCGYLVCARVGPCAPVEPEPIAEPEPEPLRYAGAPRVEVGMWVRVKDDAVNRAGCPSPWRGMTGRVIAVANSTVWLEPRIRSNISNVEPIE